MLPPGSWQRVQSLFDRAGELPDAERDGFLDVECAGDPDLREEVASLLRNVPGADTAMRGAVAAAVESLAISSASRAIGTRLGPYRLVELLGEGGMGIVYLAERDDKQYASRVAVKILRHELASQQVIERFRDERQILASLEHPGIVRMLDGASTESGLPYLVMEYVDGRPLEEYAPQLPVRARVVLVMQVAAAIQYAHQKLVIHRDVKPSNIVVDATGTPKLLDFGIAKLLAVADGHRQAKTRTGMALFTPEYASPEQARGEPVSVATDVYSLGAVLFDLLVGKPPQQAGPSMLETLRNVCEVAPPRPSVAAPPALRRELAGDLESIVLKALHKRPEHRYPSAAAFIADLERYLAGMPVSAREATLLYRMTKLIARHGGKLALAIAVALSLATMTGISIRQARRADEQTAHAQRQNIALLRERGLQELANGHASRALVLLAEALRAGDESTATRFSIAQAMRPFERKLATMDLHEGISGFAATMDGARIALTGSAGGVRVFDANGKKLFEFTTNTSHMSLPAFSHDGARLAAVSRDGHLFLWNLANGRLEHTADRVGGGVVTSLTFLDDTQLATSGRDGQLTIWNVGTGKVARSIDAGGPISVTAIAPDGHAIAVGTENGRLAIFDARSGVQLVRMDHGPEPVSLLRYARDGRLGSASGGMVQMWAANGELLATYDSHGRAIVDFDIDVHARYAVTTADGTAKVWDTHTGNQISQLVGHANGVGRARFSPDGTGILTTGNDNTFRVWDATSGQQLLVIEGDIGGGSAPHSAGGVLDGGFLPDGKQVWTASAVEVKLWRWERAPFLRELAFSGGLLSAVASPDGTRLVAVGFDGFFQIHSNNVPRTLPAPKVALWHTEWNGDGTRFVVVGAEAFASIFDRDGQSLIPLIGHHGVINSAVWSPDGVELVTAGDDGTARVWNSATGALVATLRHPDRVLGVAWSADGTKIATSGWDSKLRIWNAADHALIRAIDDSPVGLLSIAFNRRGDRLVSTGHGGEIDLWNVATGKHELSLVGHANPVMQAAWSPDGELIASGSSDHTARIWDPRTGQQLALWQQEGEVVELSWTPDGTRVITVCGCGYVRFWDVRPNARSPAELERIIREQVPYRLVDGHLEFVEWRHRAPPE